jgi:hypothetical protein
MKQLIIAITCASALTACQLEGGTETGVFSLQLTDAPVTNAKNVFLTISAITVKGPNKKVTYNIVDENGDAATKQIDLLSLTGSNAELIIEGWELEAGEYQWLRLHSVTSGAEDSYVVFNDGSPNIELTVPSGDLKLVSGFTIPANGTADFTVDIDLSRALVYRGATKDYLLKPAMRLLDNSEVGHIAGSIDGSIYANSCAGKDISNYAYAGADATVIDINGDQGPVLVAWAELPENYSTSQYELGFLNTGDYTLQMVCGPADDPEADDDLNFIGSSVNVTAEDKKTTTQDFI